MAVADKTQHTNGTTPPPSEIPVMNPVTGAEIGRIPNTPTEEVRAAVERARSAQHVWRAMTPESRCAILRRLGDLLWEHQRAVMDTIRNETGKNDAGAFIEVVVLDNVITWCVNNAPRILKPKRRNPAFPILQYARVYYKPHGVVGFITPWNYPMLLSYIDAIPALAAGNAVIIKPSEITPYSALHIADLFAQAGLPRHILQVLTGDGSTGAALTEHVDYVCFTGSTATGRKVAVKAAERLIPYSLELGGKDAMLVLKDADLELAAAGMVTGAMENAGQVCISVERVYVEDAIYDEFLERAKHYAGLINMGAGMGFDVHMGSMTNGRELERVEAHVQDAVAKGAKLVTGGKRRADLGPLFYQPTILADVTHEMDVMREETFGPVVAVMRVRNAEEAIRLANDSEYGLSGTIYTKNLPKGEHLATQIDTGDVSINRMGAVLSAPDLPSGGQKASGVGRRNGEEGLKRFVVTQAVAVDRQLGATPEVSVINPLILAAVQAMRTIRRYVPFI